MKEKIWKFLCSVKLTVVLFVLILIPAAAGTLIQQNASDPNQYIDVFGPTWDSIFRLLGFYDIYHDPRFIILLVLLGLNTFACTLNRFRPRWQIVGMLMTHLGLLLILIGALIGAIFGVQGFMAIGENETTGVIRLGRATSSNATLPFQVRLVDFILDVHEEPTRRIIVYDVKADDQSNHMIEHGQTFALSEPSWAGVMSLLGIEPDMSETITVNRVYENAAMKSFLNEGPDETGVAAVEFHLKGDGEKAQGFAISGADRPHVFEKARLGVSYRKVASADRIDDEIRNAALMSKTISRLEVTVPETPAPAVHPAEVGAEFDIKDLGYSVEVLRYVADFMMDMNTRRVASKSDHPHNPALLVRITGPSGSKEQWLFSKFPAMHRAQSEPFDIRFIMDSRLRGAADHLFVVSAPGGASGTEAVLAHVRGGKLIERTEAIPGRPIKVEGTGHEIVIDSFFENANMSRRLVDDPHAPGRAVAEVVVEQDDKKSMYRLWNDAWVDVPGYKLLYAQEDRVRDFFSILQIIDGGEVVAEKKIEVNDPLRYGGYSFYQSSYDREGLSWSGLQVRKDPGVPLVYGGFLAQILGMIVVFYINPLIRKAKKSRA